ncbi:MAG: KpsF/GutQ family sugar-phosphate isomerase [Opitutales bacterium]|nr:KpsF/GutQ family sugar-phosphate isomerase [Opitutales bacterium]
MTRNVTEDSVAAFRVTLEKERDALTRAVGRIDDLAVSRTVDLILACEDKVVLIGVGKSGIIARKIAATFSSLGTRAIHMHASDALHGDIGIVSKNDVAVLISNSGSTEEITLLLPHLRLRNIPHIAIVGNLTSQLAKEADIVLDAGVSREADDHNLAPTCSTAVQLTIGDALAVAVARMKGISPDDFAYNHPAGRLGKQLALRVGALMHQGEQNPLIGPQAPFVEVIDMLARFQAGAACVVNANNKLLGIITDGDLRRCLKRHSSENWNTLSAAEMMTMNPITVTPDVLAIDAMRIMEDRESQISVLPVVSSVNIQCVGIIRIHDIVKAGL